MCVNCSWRCPYCAREYPLQPARDGIVIPRGVLNGLLTTIHLRFDHPTQHQMKRLVTRFVFALDMDSAIILMNLNVLPPPPPAQRNGSSICSWCNASLPTVRLVSSWYCELLHKDYNHCRWKAWYPSYCSPHALLRSPMSWWSPSELMGASTFTSLSNDTNFQKHGIKPTLATWKT